MLQFKPLGDRAIVVQFGEEISLAIHTKVRAFMKLLDEKPFQGMLEFVPGYTNVCVYYDIFAVHQAKSFYTNGTPYEKVLNYLETLAKQLSEEEFFQPNRTIEIPVLYGGAYGPDLAYVAKIHDMTEDEVITLHSKNTYTVYMLGFAPGFPFMGGMDEAIATPRREIPRLKIPPGSVGIAGKQTGIYPLETPGGWQIIGRTPYPLFHPSYHPPTLLQAGDAVKFVPITEKDLLRMRGVRR